MLSCLLYLLLIPAAQSDAQCLKSVPSCSGAPEKQYQTLPSARIDNIMILRPREPESNPWRYVDPNPFDYLEDRFGRDNLRALAEYSAQAIMPFAVDLRGVENKPLDLSLRLKPAAQYKGKTLAAPVPPLEPPAKPVPAPKPSATKKQNSGTRTKQ